MSPKRSWDDLFEGPRFHWEEPDPTVVAAAPGRWRRSLRHIHDSLGRQEGCV